MRIPSFSLAALRCTSVIAVLLLVIFSACTDELAGDPVVVTEDVLFVGGDVVRLSGRLVSNVSEPVTDHGFLISQNESFSNPTVVSLGEKTQPGRFIGEASNLITGTSYYWKPFAVIGGNTLEGEVESFATLLPQVYSITPTIALQSQIMTISGRNFPSSVKVFFGDKEAQVTEVDRGSFIKVIIPPYSGSINATVRIVSAGSEVVAPISFEYVIGKWEQAGNFITAFSYTRNISFASGDSFYFGLGDENFGPNPNLWVLDVPTNSWSVTSYAGPLIVDGFSAPGYFGGGIKSFAGINNEFYKLEGATLVRKANHPFALTQCVALRVEDDLYIVGGSTFSRVVNTDIYRYVAADDQWQLVGQSIPGIEAKYPSFVHNGVIYFITADRTVYRVDPNNFIFQPVSVFPSASVEKGNGMAEVVGDRVFIGLFDSDRTVWEYNVPQNSWKPKQGFAGSSLFNATVTSFTHNGIIYVFKNPGGNSSAGMSIWTFKPDEF